MDIRQQLLEAFEAEHREHLDAIRAALAAQAAGGFADWNDVFRRAHSLKGAARAVDLPPVEALAHRLETLFERVSAGRTPLGRDTLAAVHLSLDRIESYVAKLKVGTPVMLDDAAAALDACLSDRAPPAVGKQASTPSAAPPQAVVTEPPSEAGQGVLRVPAVAVQAVTDAVYGLANALPPILSLSTTITRLAAVSNDLRLRVQTLRSSRASVDDVTRAQLADLETGSAALTRLANDLARAERSASVALEGAVARVREEAERLALVPAETAFGGFARAVRDMAREAGREVDVTVRGLDVPMDRGVLQVLKDPVLHALRNAFSHGDEKPETRQRAGKPPNLAVLFEISVRGGQVVIGIHDDGPGPDLAGIERKARDSGLLVPTERADPERLLALVFEPGFSTAASIDTISGRGIGLSVVAEAARKLQGHARLIPRVPHGASLLIRIPLAASRRAALIVEAENSAYALASAAVERVFHLRPRDLSAVAGRLVATLQEGDRAITLPFARLGHLVGTEAEGSDETCPAVLIRSGERRLVLGVERLSEVRTLLVLPPPAIGTGSNLIAGTVILGDEKGVLLLDPEGLIDQAGEGGSRADNLRMKTYENSDGTMVSSGRSTILVVDDSITTRTLEKSILEAAGYRVVVCVDGQDALDVLRAGSEQVDLVVADVEMPRLDGFGLVQALRSEEKFGRLPVILMTSRGAAEDVARGLELGADAYLTKQKFDQRELLETIGQLL